MVGGARADGRPPPLVTTKTDAVYHELRRRILDGEIPADHVLDHRTWAAELGVSTTPVREALRRLEAEHLVVMEAHRDARVAPLLVSELRNIYVVRLNLDPAAAELAAAVATDRQIADIGATLDEPAATADERADLNARFHRALYQACGNAILVAILDQLWDRSQRYRRVLLELQEEVDRADHEHRELVEALTARDGARLRVLVHAHVAHSFEQIGRLAETLG